VSVVDLAERDLPTPVTPGDTVALDPAVYGAIANLRLR